MIPGIEATPLAPAAKLGVDASLDRGVTLAPALRSAFLASGEGERNLERLFQDGALCVTTGQQPGLLTGPLLTIHKALSAAALARRCEAALDRPVVPVFWVAGDDHDFAESNHLHLLNAESEVERIALRDRPAEAASLPMYREPLGEAIHDVFARVRAVTPDTEFRDAELAWLETHYRPESTVAEAFAAALADLAGRFGVVVFRPTERAAKAASAPWILASLDAASDLDRALRRETEALLAAGEPAPVHVRDGETLVMLEGAQGRDRLVREGSGYRTRRSGETWTGEALRDLAASDPERLSANVLLRPALEAALLPTVAYVGGPGEIRYLAQAKAVFDVLGIPRQQVVTRWSGRVVEQRVRKILDRYGIEPDDLLAPDGQVEGRLVRGELPDQAQQALDTLRRSFDVEFPKLVDAAASIDPTLQKPIRGVWHNAQRDLAGAEKRIVSHLKHKDEILLRQIASARNALFPGREPQERVFNVLQYLVRYGGDYLFGVMSACEEWAAGLGSPTPRA